MQNREKLNIGEAVFCRLTSGSIVTGILVSQGEVHTKNGVEQFYQIAVLEDLSVRFVDSDIYKIERADLSERIQAEKKSYFRELSKKYSFECFDENDEIFSNSVIIGKVLYDGIWDKFDDDEKANFVNHVRLNDADIAELLETFTNIRKNEIKLADKRIKSLELQRDVYKRFESLRMFMPDGLEWSLDFLRKWIGLDELMKNG